MQWSTGRHKVWNVRQNTLNIDQDAIRSRISIDCLYIAIIQHERPPKWQKNLRMTTAKMTLEGHAKTRARTLNRSPEQYVCKYTLSTRLPISWNQRINHFIICSDTCAAVSDMDQLLQKNTLTTNKWTQGGKTSKSDKAKWCPKIFDTELR